MRQRVAARLTGRRSSRICEALKHRGREERGAIAVLVAIVLIFVFLPMGAIAIDVGSLDQQRSQAQDAADAAALAAAPTLPSSGLCSGVCVTNATTAVNKYVGLNMSGATSVITANYNGFGNEIQVTVSKATPTFFQRFLNGGGTSKTVSATAVAKESGGTTVCATPGNACYAIFAKDNNCTSGHYGIQFSGGGNNITGGILSNGSVAPGGGGSTFGASTYGLATGTPPCTWIPAGGDTSTAGPTAETSLVTSYPVDYTADFPACSGATCTGVGGTPSFCTQSSTSTAWNLTPVSGNIYCDVGTGTAANPLTWNGAITLGAGGVNAQATYVAASVAVGGGGDTLKACGYTTTGYTATTCNAGTVPAPVTANYPLIYAVSSSTTAISGGGGGSFFFGDLFAPLGTISFNGGGDTTSFLEALDVIYTGGGLIGDGPSTSGSISAGSASSSLIQ